MNREAISDELRCLEGEVVECERQFAEQEALVVALKHDNQNTTVAAAQLALMRESQHRRQQDGLRLLSLLQR
jgi:hypothetical protein